MNKVFKVLWSKIRAQHVVASEAQRASGKGRTLTSVLLGSAMLGVTGAAGAAVTATDGWNHTTITTTGSVTNVTTNYVKIETGVNRFNEFTVNKNNVANLHLPEKSKNLLNFVEQGVNVYGTVNSLKGQKVGGNLFFVTPAGMTVGKTGVINAGSLTSVVTTQKEFERMTKTENGNLVYLTDSFLTNLKKAEVPLNPTGVITVEGSINTGNRILLAASRVDVKKGALITNRRSDEDFKKLVNITLTNGSIVTAAGVTGGLEAVETADGSGDILLLARSDSSDQVKYPTVKASINAAGTINGRENVTLSALAGNGTYDLAGALKPEKGQGNFKQNNDHNKADVTAEVTVSGTVTAQKDLTVKAEAQNHVGKGGVINLAKNGTFEILGMTTPFNFGYGYGDLTTHATVTVEKDASLTAGANLTTEAFADTYLQVGTGTSALKLKNLMNIAKPVEGKIPGVGVVVGLADSSSLVDIKGNLTAGGDLAVKAREKLDVTLASTASTKHDKSSHVAVTVGKVKGTATVNVADSSTLKITGTKDEKTGKVKSGELLIEATRTSKVNTQAAATTEREAHGALAFNYTQHDSDAQVNVGAGLASGDGALKADKLTIRAQNETLSEKMKAETWGATPDGVMSKIVSVLETCSENFASGLMGEAGKGFDPSYTSTNFKLGGAVGVMTGGQHAGVEIKGGTKFAADKNATISSESVKKDHNYVVSAKSNGKKGEGQQGENVKGVGSLALLVATSGTSADETVSSDLKIGDGVDITVDGGSLVLSNRAVIDYDRLNAMKEELRLKIKSLKSYFGGNGEFAQEWKEVENAFAEAEKQKDGAGFIEKMTLLGKKLAKLLSSAGGVTGDVVAICVDALEFIKTTNYVNSYVAASGAGESGSWEAAGAVGVVLQDTRSALTIGKGVTLTARKGDQEKFADQGHVSITGESLNESVMLGGHLETIFGVSIPTVTDSNSIGASVLWHSLGTNNLVMMREGAVITADGIVSTTAKDSTLNVTVGASADVSKGSLGVDANAVLANSELHNRVWLDDEVSITGSAVVVNAAREDDIQTIAGAVTVGSNDQPTINVGAGIAINIGTITNDVDVKDNDKLDDKESSLYALKGTITATGSAADPGDADGDNKEEAIGGTVVLRSDADIAINAIGVAGAVGLTGESPEDPDGIAAKFGSWLDDVKSSVKPLGDKINNAINSQAEKAMSGSYKAGKWIRNTGNKVFGENSSTSGNLNNGNGSGGTDPNSNPGNMGENGNPTTRDENSQQPENSEQSNHFQLGAAASVGVNALDTYNRVNVEAASLTIDSRGLDAEAVTDKWVGAWAGSAAINYIKQTNNVDNSASVGGAVAVNTGEAVTTTSLKGLTKTGNDGLVLKPGVDNVTVRAIADGTIVAEGIAASVTAASGSDTGNLYSFDASVSANLLDNEVRADASGIRQKTATDDAAGIAWDQVAWSGEAQVTGGTGFGLSTQAGGTNRDASAGLIGAYAKITNTIGTTLADSTFDNVRSLDVRSLASVTQVTTAVGSNIALGDSSIAFTGAAAAAELFNTVTTDVSNVSVSLADKGRMQVIARDAAGDEKKALDAVTERDWYPSTNSELNNSEFYKDVVLKTEKDQAKEDGEKVSNFLTGKGMVQTTVAVSAGVSTEDNAGGAAVIVNNIDNTFKTKAKGVTVTQAGGRTGSYDQRAESGVVSVAVGTGIAAAVKGDHSHYAAAGTVIVTKVDQTASSEADDLDIKVKDAGIKAGNAATTVNVAGNVGVSMGEGGSGLGAAVVVMNTNDDASVTLKNSTLEADAVTAEAKNQAQAWGAAADATVTGKYAMGGSVVVNRMLNTTAVTADKVTLRNVNEAAFKAHDVSKLWNLAGAVAYGGSNAGLSGAVSYSISGRESSPGTNVTVSDLTVERTGASAAKAGSTKVDVTARGDDQIRTLVIAAGVSKGTLGFTGASGVNEVKRKVNAELRNVTGGRVTKTDGSALAGAGSAIGALSVRAEQNASIGNLGIAGAYGEKLGAGLGISVNRIWTDTTAKMTDNRKTKQTVEADTISVKAKTSNDIDTIAIGGAASQTLALAGSTGINLVTDNTTATMTGVNASVSGAALVDAQSDDVIGAYVGQVAGSKTGAGGLSVLVNERKGETRAEVSSSTVTETGTTSSTLEDGGHVAADAVNNKVANDVSTGATLETKRTAGKTDGIKVQAGSTATFKSFVINGAGAVDGAGAGTSTVTYHGGATKAVVKDSTLTALKGDVSVAAGNWVNVDNVSTTVAGAGQGAGTIGVNVVTTEHATQAEVDGGTLKSSEGKTSVTADAKEGVSSLAIQGAGAKGGAGTILVNVTRELSDASVKIAATKNTTLEGGKVEAQSAYLGRTNTMGLTAAGALYGAGAVSVNVNYNDNDATTEIGKAELAAKDKVEIDALRRAENGAVVVNAAGAGYGAGVATVTVNTIEGKAHASTDGAKIHGIGAANPDVTIAARGEDKIDRTEVTATGAAYGSGGAAVMVNRLYGSALTEVKNSTIRGNDVVVKAEQKRIIDVENVFASGSLGTLGANVVSTLIGSGGDPFDSTNTGLGDTSALVDKYVKEYGGSSTTASPGVLGSAVDQTGGVLTEEEKSAMVEAAAKKAAADASAGGTKTLVSGSDISGKTVAVTAEEDTGNDARIDVEVGSGNAGAGVLAASVATLRQHRNLVTEVVGSNVTSQAGGTIGVKIGGTGSVKTYQAVVALVTGAAAYTDVEITGGGNVVVDQSRLESTGDVALDVLAQDKSKMTANAFGLNVAEVSGGGTIAKIRDGSSLKVGLTHASMAGVTSVHALRETKRTADVLAGVGGVVNGMAAQAGIADTGNVTIEAEDLNASGKSLEIEANNQPNLTVKANEGYLSAMNVGVLTGNASVSGKTAVTVKSSRLEAADVVITAASGHSSANENGEATDDKSLKMTADVKSNGAAIVGGWATNDAKLENNTTTKLTVEKNVFSSGTKLSLKSEGRAVYDAVSDLGTGGVLAGGNSYAEVKHNARVEAAVSSENASLESLALQLANQEKATLKAYSAGGTVIEVSEKAAQVNHADTSETLANVSGSWHATGDVTLGSSSTHELGFLVDNTKGVVTGGSSVLLENRMAGKNTLNVSGSIDAGKNLSAAARTDLQIGAVSGKTYAVDNAVYGAVAGAEGRATSSINRETAVNVADKALMTADGDLKLSAFTKEVNDLRVRARTAGVANGVTAFNDNTITLKNAVTIGKSGILQNRSSEHDVILSASSDEKLNLEAVGDVQGSAVGGAGAKSRNTITNENAVTMSGGSLLNAAGDAKLYAGRDTSGANAKFDFKGYTHAYAHSLGGADSVLKDTFGLGNALTLNGDVTAVRHIDGAATVGDWTLNETSRYWVLTSHKDAGNVKIASSAAGDKNASGFSSNDRITVNGRLTAGTQTHSRVEISGIVDSGSNGYQISGSRTDPVISVNGVKGQIATGSESVANSYKERYEELMSLIREYGDKGDKEDRTVLLAYRSEAQALKQKMIAQGLAVFNGDKIVSIVEKDHRGFVKVEDITVSGGSISLTTGRVEGTGKIAANAAQDITIDNKSNLALTVEDVRILEKGGDLTLNGVTVESLQGFKGTVSSQATSADPTITINSDFGGKVTVTGNGMTKTVTPDNSVTLHGVVANDAGDLNVKTTGDMVIMADRVAAATSMKLDATGSVMQSYAPGIHNVGGRVEDQWAGSVNQTNQNGSCTSNDTKNSTSQIVAGGDIFINADNVNLNGTVQSGYAQWGADLTGLGVEWKIWNIRRQWLSQGAPTTIDPMSNAYLLSKEGTLKRDDGSFSKRVAAWYDPVNDRIIVDDIVPQGGHIYITGRIASTGSGKLYAAAGSATLKVDAGNHDVKLGDISTGKVHGLIEITDTMHAGKIVNGKTVDALVSKWTNDGTGMHRQTEWLYADGSTGSTSNYYSPNQYNPITGLAYMWSTGTNTGTVTTTNKTESFKWWGLYEPGDPSTWGSSHTTEKENAALGSGATIGAGKYNNGQTNLFEGWVTESNKQEGQWKVDTWTTYDNWTHWSGTYHSYAEKHSTSTKVYTYSVKADQAVDVGFLQGDNSITVTGNRNILLGGKIEAAGGSVSLNAGSSILNDSANASISGASNVSLTAKNGSLGTQASAINLIGTEGTLKLNATASKDIYLDAHALKQGANVKADTLHAGSTLDVLVRGDLSVADMSAVNFNLVSRNGSIDVANLVQGTEADGLQRFDAKAAGSITLKNVQGDLGLGKVQAGESVAVTINNGSLTDAFAREDLDNRNAEEKIQGWIDAGILGADGSDNGLDRWNADVKSHEDMVKAAFTRLEAYRKLDEKGLAKLTDEQRSDFASLETRFGPAVTTADQAVAREKANADSDLSKTIAAKDNYGWTKAELLYAISDAIVNPDAGAVPTAGEANIEAKSVRITTTGSVGNELPTKTFKFSELDVNTEVGLNAYKVLARADVNDVVWDKANQTVTVTLKRPISLKQLGTEGRLDASASNGSVFIASDDKLHVGAITAKDELRLTSQKGIEAAKNVTNSLLTGNFITLRGGVGTLGSKNQALNINAGEKGWAALTAQGGVYVNETNGDLRILSAASGGEMVLSGQNIVMANSEQQGADGLISAESLTLDVNNEAGSIGTGETALRVKSDTDITFADDVVKSVNIEGRGTADFVIADTITATDGVKLAADGSLVVKSNVSGNTVGMTAKTGSLTANTTVMGTESLNVRASQNVDVSGATLTGGSVDLNAGKDLVASGATVKGSTLTATAGAGNAAFDRATVETTGASTIVAGGDLTATDAVMNADGLSLTAQNGNVDASSAKLSTKTGALSVEAKKALTVTDANLSGNTVGLTATTGSVTATNAVIAANDSLAVTATDGKVDLSTADHSKALIASSLTVTAGADADLGNRKVVAATDATVTAGGSVNATEADLQAGGA